MKGIASEPAINGSTADRKCRWGPYNYVPCLLIYSTLEGEFEPQKINTQFESLQRRRRELS